jgi:hypothetical protein
MPDPSTSPTAAPTEEEYQAARATADRLTAATEDRYFTESERQEFHEALNTERAYHQSQREARVQQYDGEKPPWNGSSDELQRNYGPEYSGDGLEAERADGRAALDWAQNGDPEEGKRPHANSDHYWQDGKLWNDGVLLGPNGENEPFVVWSDPARSVEEACAAVDEARARAAEEAMPASRAAESIADSTSDAAADS